MVPGTGVGAAVARSAVSAAGVTAFERIEG